MKKHLVKILLTSLVAILLSCNSDTKHFYTRKQLNDDEINVVNKFLECEWYDVQFKTFLNENVYNELKLIFKLENSKLKYNRNRYYRASFGNEEYVDSGDVKIYYDTELSGVGFDLLNENNEVMESGLIKIPRDEIISTFTEYLKNRTILSNPKNRNDNNKTYGKWDRRGVFVSKVLYRYQSGDYSLNYDYDFVRHYEDLGMDDNLSIRGFSTTLGNPKIGSFDVIQWELKELFVDKNKSK